MLYYFKTRVRKRGGKKLPKAIVGRPEQCCRGPAGFDAGIVTDTFG